jgi:cell division septation protein DedD
MTRRMGSAGLGFGQLFVLIFGFLIASALIFLFGIWVGRDVAERRLAQEERVVRQPIPTQPPKEEKAGSDVDLSFYEGLKEKAYQRLQETAAAPPATTARVTQASKPTPTPARVGYTSKPTPAVRVAPRPTPPLPTPAIFGPRAEPPREKGDEWADAGWTVQVNATTNPQQANELARDLRAKGYDAYTVQAPLRGQTWYRVRVGRFTNREKAKDMEQQLKSREGLENAYITPQ